MTRINAGIPVKKLSNQLLIAEHREIKRIPNKVASGKFSLKGQPTEFKLGTGHVKFFYTRLLYLKKRYETIYTEGIRRGINFTYFGDAWNDVPPELMNDYKPTDQAKELVIQRMKDNGVI